MKNTQSNKWQHPQNTKFYNFHKTSTNPLSARFILFYQKTINYTALKILKHIGLSASVILICLLSSPFIYAQNNPDKDAKLKIPAVYPAEKPKTSIHELEQQVFEILNKKRVEAKLLPVKWNEDVAKIARSHSVDMAKNNYFSQIGLTGLTVTDRAKLSGFINWREIYQTIASNQGNEKPAEVACKSWLDSPLNSQNILDKKWTATGIGIAVSLDESYYFTAVFISN